jgi:hypothetical protein
MCGRHQTQKAQRLLLTTVCFFWSFVFWKKNPLSEEFECEDQMQRKIDGEFVSVCFCECNNLSHSFISIQLHSYKITKGHVLQGMTCNSTSNMPTSTFWSVWLQLYEIHQDCRCYPHTGMCKHFMELAVHGLGCVTVFCQVLFLVSALSWDVVQRMMQAKLVVSESASITYKVVV